MGYLRKLIFMLDQIDESINQLRGVRFSLFSSFYLTRRRLYTHLSYANTVDPDQTPDRTPRVAAARLSLHC